MRRAASRNPGHSRLSVAAATVDRSRSCGLECSTAARVFAERGLPGRSASAAGWAWENFPASAGFGAAGPRMGALRKLTGCATSRRAAVSNAPDGFDEFRSLHPVVACCDRGPAFAMLRQGRPVALLPQILHRRFRSWPLQSASICFQAVRRNAGCRSASLAYLRPALVRSIST